MLNIRRVAIAVVVSIAFAGPIAASARAEPIDVDTAVIFVVDVSSSMDRNELTTAREAHAAAVTSALVLQAISQGAIGRIAVTYVEFAGHARQSIDWTIIDGRRSAERFASRIRGLRSGSGPGTSISSALFLARDLFEAMPYRATAKVVDVVGDGADRGVTWLGAIRAVLIDRGVVINGMPLVIDPSQPHVAAFYATAVVGGPGHFAMPVNRIDQMQEALRRKITRELF